MEKLTTTAKDLTPGLMIDHEYDDCKHRDVLITEVKSEPNAILVKTMALDEEDKPVINDFRFHPEEELATTDFLYKLRLVEKRNDFLDKVIKNCQKDLNRHYETMAEIETKFRKIENAHYNTSTEEVFHSLRKILELPPF